MNRLVACLAFVFAAGVAIAPTSASSHFDSEIAVGADASMHVTETIRVRAEGDRIRHGIYRDFPTDYRDRLGNRVHVDFEPEDVTRDGAAEPFHSERRANGVRVYFGSKDVAWRPANTPTRCAIAPRASSASSPTTTSCTGT